jgi:hypothetical protein
MKFEELKHEVILNAIFSPTEAFIEKLESLGFIGKRITDEEHPAFGLVRAQAKTGIATIVIWKPDKMLPGIQCLVRAIDRFGKHKIIFIPESDKMEEGREMDPCILIGQLARFAGACEGEQEAWIQTIDPSAKLTPSIYGGE